MNPESLTTFDRRGARAVGSQPAPLLVLTRCGGLQKSQRQKTKTKKEKPFTQFSLQNLLHGKTGEND
jgi:hypothetical protein